MLTPDRIEQLATRKDVDGSAVREFLSGPHMTYDDETLAIDDLEAEFALGGMNDATCRAIMFGIQEDYWLRDIIVLRPVPNKIWDILVEHAGAREEGRSDFLRSMDGTCYEYRFQGSLGFGGKLYAPTYGDFRISCYPEDETQERKAAITTVNELLKKFPPAPQ